MRNFVGQVQIHNGRFQRTFDVRVQASVWTYAIKLAAGKAIEQFRSVDRRRITGIAVLLNVVPGKVVDALERVRLRPIA